MTAHDHVLDSNAATLHGPVMCDRYTDYREWGYQHFQQPNTNLTDLTWIDPGIERGDFSYHSRDNCQTRD